MREDKRYIFTLRKSGLSYREIQKQTGVSRGTLARWFRDELWSKHQTVRHIHALATPEQSVFLQKMRQKNRMERYARIEQEATDQYRTLKGERLFWAGLMAYACSGDKVSPNAVRLSSSEFYVHAIFHKFLSTYAGIARSDVRCALFLYGDQNESLCKEMWVNMLGISRNQFYKTQVISGKERKRRLQYGVAMSILSDTVLKKRLLQWLSLAQDERFDIAGMV